MFKNTNWFALPACNCTSPDTLGPTPDTTGRTRTHAPSPTLAAPVLNHTPFARRSTAQQAGHRTRAHWPLPPHGTGDPRTALQPREPCQLFGRLAKGCGGMDRLSGAPPLHLGLVRRGARQRREARTHARGQRRWRRAKRPGGPSGWALTSERRDRAGTGYARLRGSAPNARSGRDPRSSVWPEDLVDFCRTGSSRCARVIRTPVARGDFSPGRADEHQRTKCPPWS